MDLQSVVTCDHRAGDPVEVFTLTTCPKCLGKGYYADFVIGTSNVLLTTDSISYLMQAIRRLLSTKRRASGYGFDLALLSKPSAQDEIKNEVMRCLQYLKTLQDMQIRQGFYYRTTEKIDSLTALSIIPTTDVRKVIISLNCITTSGNQVTLSLPVKQ